MRLDEIPLEWQLASMSPDKISYYKQLGFIPKQELDCQSLSDEDSDSSEPMSEELSSESSDGNNLSNNSDTFKQIPHEWRRASISAVDESRRNSKYLSPKSLRAQLALTSYKE